VKISITTLVRKLQKVQDAKFIFEIQKPLKGIELSMNVAKLFQVFITLFSKNESILVFLNNDSFLSAKKK
jgi:hypothetical protein